MNYHFYILEHTRKLIVAFIATLVFGWGHAQPDGNGRSIFDLMNHQDVLDITISADLDSIIAGRREKDDLEATLVFQDAEGGRQEWAVDLSIRGRFRRVHCATPPLRIDFKKSNLEKAGLAAFDDLKLVTHCVADPFLAKELIMKEYLVYKLYNLLTEYSYRVQLVRVTYRNPDTGKEDQQWGFLIEDTAQLSARLQAEKVEIAALPVDTLDQPSFRIMALLQYMIGNPDWGLEPTKNLQYLAKGDRLIPVAYDFDFAGLVDAPYARPTVTLRLQPAQQLVYARIKEQEASFRSTFRLFRANQDEMLKTVRQLKTLSLRSRNEVTRHLSDFFDRTEMEMADITGQ